MLEKYSNINFHENVSIGSRVVPYDQTNGKTEMIFRSVCKTAKNGFADTPKIILI